MTQLLVIAQVLPLHLHRCALQLIMSCCVKTHTSLQQQPCLTLDAAAWYCCLGGRYAVFYAG